MFLSVQQKYIVETVRRLGCLRREQLLVLARERFRRPDLVLTPERLDAMLRQLRFGVESIRLEGDMVCLPGVEPDPRLMEAVDVMLELSEGTPLDFQTVRDVPFLLRFSLGGDTLRLFSVADLLLPDLPEQTQRRRMERIVWITKDGTAPVGLALPRRHFFAVRQQDGTHRFYGSNEP